MLTNRTSAKGGDPNVEVSCNEQPCDRAWAYSVAIANARRAGDCAVRPLHILVVEYDIVPGEIDKYLTAVKELGAASVKEAGFRQQYITISQNDPNHVLLFEAWDDASAHAAHVATDRFKKYQATTGSMIAKRNVRTFSSVAMLSP